MHPLLRLASPLLMAGALPAMAADLRVTTFVDEYDGECTRQHCSLREAVSAGNALGQARIILEAGEYRLSRPNLDDDEGEPLEENDNLIGDLDVTGELTVIGRGHAATVLNGNGIDRLFHVLPEGRLLLRDLSLTGGHTDFRGGGLANQGYTELVRVRVVNNGASSMYQYGQGGGIFNSGSLLLRTSDIFGNGAGGSEASLGSGGGIYNTGALWIRDSRIGDSRCSDDNDSGEGCGLYNEGHADIARSLFVGNRGGYGSGSAILNRGQLRLANSTLSDNGDRKLEGTASLHNGGGWRPEHLQAQAELFHVTIAGNHEAGLINAARVVLRNSIIAGNSLGAETLVNCVTGSTGTYLARGLLLGADGGSCNADRYISDGETFTRHLYPLTYAGHNAAHPLRRTSAAIDAGVGNCASHDQRSQSRPRDGDGDGVANCDLGSFERANP